MARRRFPAPGRLPTDFRGACVQGSPPDALALFRCVRTFPRKHGVRRAGREAISGNPRNGWAPARKADGRRNSRLGTGRQTRRTQVTEPPEKLQGTERSGKPRLPSRGRKRIGKRRPPPWHPIAGSPIGACGSMRCIAMAGGWPPARGALECRRAPAPHGLHPRPPPADHRAHETPRAFHRLRRSRSGTSQALALPPPGHRRPWETAILFMAPSPPCRPAPWEHRFSASRPMTGRYSLAVMPPRHRRVPPVAHHGRTWGQDVRSGQESTRKAHVTARKRHGPGMGAGWAAWPAMPHLGEPHGTGWGATNENGDP